MTDRRLIKRINASLDKAIEKKGYLSLCAIIESQYRFPRTYPLSLRKQPGRLAIHRPTQPQPRYLTEEYRAQKQARLASGQYVKQPTEAPDDNNQNHE